MPDPQSSKPTPESDREIVMSRVLHAPRALVWEAWTNPAHVTQWWGPRGFRTEIKQMDFRVGGVWAHTMIGPDGTRFPNKSVFKEIVPQERIVFSHGGGSEEGPGANFMATWTFETVEGGLTRITGRLLFPSREMRDMVAEKYGAVEGGRQTLERLSEHLPAMQGESFTITRELAAPLALVWRVWTEREHFARWFGPKGMAVNLAKFDLRAGGLTHYSLRTPDGQEMWGRAVYREIVPSARLVWINAFSDKDCGITRHPFSKDSWPLQMLTTVTFAESNGKTAVTVHWLPYEATEVEWKTFNAARAGMGAGWGGTFEQLTTYLAEVAART